MIPDTIFSRITLLSIAEDPQKDVIYISSENYIGENNYERTIYTIGLIAD